MSSSVLIYAAGEGMRWQGALPKQLIDVRGEPIIGRIIRQVRARGYVPIVVTHNHNIEYCAQSFGAICHMPKDRRWLAETMLSTVHYWYQVRGISHLLLGDVVYSGSLMNTILDKTPDKNPIIYGMNIELFALSLSEQSAQRVTAALETAIQHAEKHPLLHNAGKLWNVYRALEGIPLMEHTIKEPGIFQRVTDWSTDIDSPALYERFMKNAYQRVDDLP
jgi:choline kinase